MGYPLGPNDLLHRLVATPTTLGNEEAGQRIVESTLREIGLESLDVPMDAAALSTHPQAAPFDWDVAGKRLAVRARRGGHEGWAGRDARRR